MRSWNVSWSVVAPVMTYGLAQASGPCTTVAALTSVTVQAKCTPLGSKSVNCTTGVVSSVSLAGPLTTDGAEGGAVSTTQRTLADAALPAESNALTVNPCFPSVSPDNDSGLVQEDAVAPSNAHVTDVAAGSAVKAMLAEVELVGLAGATTTGTLGAVRSTIQVLAGEDAELPAASYADTVSECEPSAKPPWWNGLVQSDAVCPSTAHL